MVGLALGLVVGATAIYFGFLNPGGQNRSVTQVASDTSESSDRNDDQLQSQLGEIREVRLKDGSRVTLDTERSVLSKYNHARRDGPIASGRPPAAVDTDTRHLP